MQLEYLSKIELNNLLVNQFYQELTNEQFYLVIASIFNKNKMDGFYYLLKDQADEEHTHAMKFYHHLIENKVNVVKSEENENEDKSKDEILYFEFLPYKLINLALEKEKFNTNQITGIKKKFEHNDNESANYLLEWFITEQEEEEEKFSKILDMMKIEGENFTNDFYLKSRLEKIKSKVIILSNSNRTKLKKIKL